MPIQVILTSNIMLVNLKPDRDCTPNDCQSQPQLFS